MSELCSVSNIVGQKIGMVITEDGEVSMIKPENNKHFTFAELYKVIGCREIEILDSHVDKDVIFLCDADVPNDVKVNRVASMLIGYGLRGNAVCCDTKMIR